MKCLPIRFFIGLMIFFTTFTNYMMRSNMSTSIIDMVEKKGSNFTPPCLRGQNITKVNRTKTQMSSQRFDWSEQEQGHIIGAYFYGYLISVMPGGIISEMWSPTLVIFYSTMAQAFLAAAAPVSAKAGGMIGLCANRFLTGLFGGVGYPAVNILIAKWAPPKEKGKFMAAMMGNTLGTPVTWILVGWMTSWMGWEWGFYILVIVLCVFCVLFYLITRDYPEKHPWISEAEVNYIKESQEGHVSRKKGAPPYLKILTSFPFWMVVVAQFGNLWALNLIITNLPKHMSKTLGFNLKSSTGLAALPYFGRLIFSSVFGLINDYLLKKEVMTLRQLRKFWVIFSHYIPAATMCLISVAGCNAYIVTALLVINQSCNGAVVVSHLVGPQDLAPNYAGSVYGLMNLFTMPTGGFVPQISGAINDYYHMELTAATVIYTLGGAIVAFCGVIFMLFGSCNVQPWNDIDSKKDEGEKA